MAAGLVLCSAYLFLVLIHTIAPSPPNTCEDLCVDEPSLAYPVTEQYSNLIISGSQSVLIATG